MRRAQRPQRCSIRSASATASQRIQARCLHDEIHGGLRHIGRVIRDPARNLPERTDHVGDAEVKNVHLKMTVTWVDLERLGRERGERGEGDEKECGRELHGSFS